MADMTVGAAMEKYGPGEITRGDPLELDDPNCAPENVALVMGGGAGVGRAGHPCPVLGSAGCIRGVSIIRP